MKIVCDNQVGEGIVMVPSSSPAFPKMRDEVIHHLRKKPPGSPPPLPHSPGSEPDLDDPVAAILWNGSGRSICAWTISWTFASGQRNGSTEVIVPAVPSILLPFGVTQERWEFLEYWHTILPDSKRLLLRGQMIGSNADIRPPADSEKWKGGVMGLMANRDRTPLSELATVTVTLDAVFFATGECAGRDRYQLFETVTGRAAAYREAALIAKEASAVGEDDAGILAAVATFTGPADQPRTHPPPPGHRDHSSSRAHEIQSLAHGIGHTRTSQGDAAAVKLLLSWTDAELPNYRRI
jgi:hypothetical protein